MPRVEVTTSWGEQKTSKTARELEIGDLIDLEGDTYFDPDSDNVTYEFEYAEVFELEHNAYEVKVVLADETTMHVPADHTFEYGGNVFHA